jgi:hypothetical protein
MASARVASVLAGLRGATAAERVAAAAALTSAVDIDEVCERGGDERAATDRHAAALAYAAGGAFGALAPLLRAEGAGAEGAGEARAACRALCALFATLELLQKGRATAATPGATPAARVKEDVTLPATAQLWRCGGAERLCALLAHDDTALAVDAASAMQFAVATAGWSAPLERVLNTDTALSSLLALAGGANAGAQPGAGTRTTRSRC